MKLILRRNDSATSLLLFIYNNYMAKNKNDSMKLTSLLEIIKGFGKNETAIRMSLSRAVKAGLLVNSRVENEVVYTLTTEGKNAIHYWNEGVMQYFKRYQLRNQQWDNKWYFIYVDFTEENKDTKGEFLDKLQQMGFAQINTNTWVSPYHQSQEVWKSAKQYGLEDRIVEVHGEMKIHKDMNRFLDDLYGIEKLRTAYLDFVDAYSGRLNEIKQLCTDQSFIENGTALPILHELGFSFFNIAADDASIPKQLLPEWEADQAAWIMKELRTALLEAVYQYLEKF